MSIDLVREVATSFPNVTEQLQWGDHLLFKIGGKMFAVTALSPEGNRISLKTTPEKFYELVEIDGVVPAPYMAKNFWVALETWDAVSSRQLRELIRESYELVLAKLPKRTQAALTQPAQPVKKKTAVKSKAKKKSTKKASRRG